VLATVLDVGLELGARAGLVSGSGPTIAFLVGSQAEAIDLSVGLAANGPSGDIVRALGPVPGCQIVPQRVPGAPASAPPPSSRPASPATSRPGPLGPVPG
jgi:4-diphosphocytidyl-2-C-methyl-D-erythritol kinase